jgi:transcriptional regulator with XRE-family HTH domain
MNSVEKVKAICKEKKIPISKLERDLGFGNGYVGQLKKGSFPDDRLLAIANYLNVTTDYLMGSEQKENPTKQPLGEVIPSYSDLSPDNQKKVRDFIDALLTVQQNQ